MAGNGTEKYEWLRALWASMVGACILATGCSTAKPTPMCAKTSSLLRFESPSAPLTLANRQFFSNGGFIEVNTRQEILGAIGSSRTCTAYIEYSDSPAESESVLNSEELRLNVYTASHCLDLSKDHSLKLHIFDTGPAVYYPVFVRYAALDKIQELRRSMKQKNLSADTQRQVLNSFRTNVPSLEGLFNQPTTSSQSIGAGVSANAGKICLRKDDPDFQNVCATYHDLVVIKVEPDPSTPAAVIDRLKEIRASAITRQKGWINSSGLAKKFTDDANFRVTFSDESANPLDLIGVHKAVRQRIHMYSKFKMLKFLNDDLSQILSGCAVASNQTSPICGIQSELSQVVQSALVGTKYERFEPSGLSSVVNVLKAEFSAAQQRMDNIFTVFESLIVTNPDGTRTLPLTARLHSNFRFVTDKDSLEDHPDPADTSRAFMNIHANNLTGDNTGSRVFFIKWSDQQFGRFSHLQISRTFTQQMRDQAAAKSTPTQTVYPNVGFLQAGDSGSVMVIEHLPYFVITSVDGQSTSGGATIRPLPEPIEEEVISVNPAAAAVSSKPSKLCK